MSVEQAYLLARRVAGLRSEPGPPDKDKSTYLYRG